MSPSESSGGPFARTDSRGLRVWPWPIAIAALAIAVYANAVPNGFALDDIPLVRDNPRLADGAFWQRFAEPYWPTGGEAAGLYRPLTILSLVIDRSLLGAEPSGFHAVNVVLHAVVCVLVWAWARRSDRAYGTALLTAALFAVHPIHTEAVANIAGRAELVAALCVIGAWLAHRRARDAASSRSSLVWGSAAVGLVLAGALAKEHAIVAPALFWIDDRARAARSTPLFSGIGPFLAYGASIAAALAARVSVLGSVGAASDAIVLDNPLLVESGAARVGTSLWLIARYAGLTAWPAALSSDYSLDAIAVVRTLTDPRWLVGAAVLGAAIAGIALGIRRRLPALAVGCGTFLLFLLPGSNLLFPVGTIFAERLLYLPSLGACLLAGTWGARLASRDRRAAIAVTTVAVVALAAGGIRTVARNGDWRDNRTLALADVRTQPRSAKLHAGAAIALHADGEPVPAERHYRRALDLWPDYAQAAFNLGVLLSDGGRDDEAIDWLERAERLSPTNPRPPRRLAKVLARSGRPGEAADAYARAVRLSPENDTLRFDQGRTLFAAGREEEAFSVWTRLAEDAPDGWPGRMARMLVLQSRGDVDGVRQTCVELLRDRSLPDAIRSRVERICRAPGP